MLQILSQSFIVHRTTPAITDDSLEAEATLLLGQRTALLLLGSATYNQYEARTPLTSYHYFAFVAEDAVD